jgi:hypothetical protein
MKLQGLVCLAFCALNLLAAGSILSQCPPGPAWKAAVSAAVVLDDFARSRETRIASLRDSLRSSRSGIWIETAWQDTLRPNFFLDSEFDKALARYDTFPDKPAASFLRLRLLLYSDPKRASAGFNALLSEFPRSPWPRIALLELLNSPYLSDDVQAARHAEAVLNACPAALPVYPLLGVVADSSLLLRASLLLRSQIAADISYATLPYWPVLWALESRTAPASPDSQRLRSVRIRSDLAMISSLPAVPSRAWLDVFDQASEALNDPSIAAKARQDLRSRFPFSSFVSRASSPYDWKKILSAPVASRLSVLDAHLDLVRDSPELGYSVPSLPLRVAELYLDWNVRLDQVQSLIEEGMALCRRQHRYQPLAFDSSQRPLPSGGPGCPHRIAAAKAAELRSRLDASHPAKAPDRSLDPSN